MQSIRFNRLNWLSASGAPVRVFHGGKSQQSTSQVSVPPEVLAQYQNVNSIANQVAQTPFQQYSTDPNAFVAGLTPTQQAGVLGTNQYSNEAQPFYQGASNQNQAATSTGQNYITTALNNNSQATQASENMLGTSLQQTKAAGQPITQPQIDRYTNPYLQDVINPTSDLMKQQFNQAQSGQLGNAIQNGAFGGDRSAVAAANLQQQQALAYGQTIGGLENQNYSQALGEANTEQQAGLQSANQYGQLGATFGGLGQANANSIANYGSAYGGMGQAGATTQANIGSGAQSAGLAGAQAQLTAGQAQQQTEQAGETALYNQFLQQQSYPFQTAQFLANIAEGTGSLSGSTTTTNQPAPFFSDERLKEDIEPIGELFDGQKVIKFRYKGEKQKHVGLSAQDVEKHHPEAVGLAGGYKTVDYDAATKDAAQRRHRDAGGFLLDPSYLEAQEQSYSSSPWGNAGLGVSATPYGGKSHVPPSTGGHGQLAVAKTPSGGSGGGLGGMASSLGQLESLGKSGKSLWNDAKGSGLFGGGNSSPSVGAPPPVQPAPPPAANSDTPAPSNDASAGSLADLGGGLAPDMSGLEDDIFDLASRGGRMHRDGGGPTFNQPTDDNNDDSSSGGDIPYDAGTGMQGLGIPDDRNNNHLAVAQPPQQQSGGGGFNPLSIVTGALGLFGLKQGGRVGLAGGGDPGDMPLPSMDDAVALRQSDSMPLPSMDDAVALRQSHAAPVVDEEYRNRGKRSLAQALGMSGYEDTASRNPPAAPVAGLAPANTSQGRDITVNKAPTPVAAPPRPAPAVAPQRPAAGLNPNAPSPDAQPVQAVQDMGSGQHLTQPGEVLTQDNPGGVGDFLNKNQGLLVPILHGLGTMASSNSRYLGSAILQGLGGAADSYENVQNEMQSRLGNQPIVQQRQNDALQSDLNAWQSYTAQTGAQMSFADFERMKAAGKIQTNQVSGGASSGQGSPYKYTIQEKNSLILPNGIPANQDPAYLAQFAAKNAGIHSEMVAGQVHQSNEQAGAINGQNFTYNNQGQQVTPNNYAGRVVAQAEPAVQAKAGADFRDAKTNFLNSYQPTQSLLNEMTGIYQVLQTGPTADIRARIAKLANDIDPNGKFPLIHSLSDASTGEDYDTAMKDIAQITAQRLGAMSQNAPKSETELLSQFAANPDKSPGTVRDVIIRGQALLNQQRDYYKGYDPFRSNQAVPDYTDSFYENHPFESYRGKLEKAVPAFKGEQGNQRNVAGQTQAPGAPVILDRANPDAAYERLPSGTHFVGPDGKPRVKP